MNYPDGSLIRVGDLIWWDGGACVGYVQVVARSKSEYEAWGLDSPHLFLSNQHPFDPSLRTGIAYDETALVDDGIGRLSDEDKARLQKATLQANTSVAAGLDFSSYSVNAVIRECRQVGWKFTSHKAGTTVASIEVPLEP